MKFKKIPYKLLLLLFAMGASLIIGFLTLSGMLVLLPILSVAFGSFVLTVAYEAEIYLQNIKGAFNKLFKGDYLKNYLGNKYLLKHFPKAEVNKNLTETLGEDIVSCNTQSTDDRPQFFKDYQAQLELWGKFGHKRLDKESGYKKEQVEKTLRDMEKWFAVQLFSINKEENANLTDYEIGLRNWLRKNKEEEWKVLLLTRQTTFNGVKIWSVLAGSFMGLGSTYLLLEASAVIPLLATLSFLPILIAPMALIAGAAYGFLIFNAFTDMINNNTLRKWYSKISKELKQEVNIRNVVKAVVVVALFTLPILLTFCSAGTWWTVAQNSRPLFAWMGKMPNYVMGVINPIVTGLSELIFNFQNTGESLQLIGKIFHKIGKAITRLRGRENWLQINPAQLLLKLTLTPLQIFHKIVSSITMSYQHLREKENWLQIVNPARLILKLILTPLRIVLFIAHLVTISAAEDRAPGIPAIISTMLGILAEGFEHAHYFGGDFFHEHKHSHDIQDLLRERLKSGHGHDHSADLPTRMLKRIFSPIYACAAAWDSYFSKRNKNPEHVLLFSQAWDKQQGLKKEKSVALTSMEKPSEDWQVQHAVFRIEHYMDKHLHKAKIHSKIAEDKVVQLKGLQQQLRELDGEEKKTVTTLIVKDAETNRMTYNKQRFFSQEDKTRTQDFLENLPQRIGAPAA